jgi:hypothetical protein
MRNPRCQRDKMRNVHTFRRSILHLQYDAEAIAILSASMSAATVKEAERLAARDADDAQQVATTTTTTAIRRVASLPCCSFSTTKGWNQSSGPSSAAGAYFMGYSMFSHRKMPRNSSYYVLSSPQV